MNEMLIVPQFAIVVDVTKLAVTHRYGSMRSVLPIV